MAGPEAASERGKGRGIAQGLSCTPFLELEAERAFADRLVVPSFDRSGSDTEDVYKRLAPQMEPYDAYTRQMMVFEFADATPIRVVRCVDA